MTEHTPPSTGDDVAAPDGSPRHGFETPEGLRALLIRLHDAGPGAWRSDRQAAELMRYTAERYRRLARKYGLDEWEVASAAFEVMLAPSTRNAGNPWAVVTRAVQITCIAEARASCVLSSWCRPFQRGFLGQFGVVLGRVSVAGVLGYFMRAFAMR